jgi:hypothetical protein
MMYAPGGDEQDKTRELDLAIVLAIIFDLGDSGIHERHYQPNHRNNQNL